MSKKETVSLGVTLSNAAVKALESAGLSVEGTEICDDTAAGQVRFEGVKIRGPHARAAASMLEDIGEPDGRIDDTRLVAVMTSVKITRYAEIRDEANRIANSDGLTAMRAYVATIRPERDALLGR